MNMIQELIEKIQGKPIEIQETSNVKAGEPKILTASK